MPQHKFTHTPKQIPVLSKPTVPSQSKKKHPVSLFLDINPEREIQKVYDLRKEEKIEKNSFFKTLTTPPSKLPHIIHFSNVYIQLTPFRDTSMSRPFTKIIIYDESLQHAGFKATLFEQHMVTKPPANYKFSMVPVEDKSQYSIYPAKANKILKRIRWSITVKHEKAKRGNTFYNTVTQMIPHSYILYKEMTHMHEK
ncbi:unnamed protein product [Ambrosiozyma monospora]|uniref:Unnamed protein product n=1 Tax=Ambrosiozyma monospora TaxID=43982 RepID=A0A9W6YZ84_AMBMO|nr:unnamed protein product [Ambrosiozyma monospora]